MRVKLAVMGAVSRWAVRHAVLWRVLGYGYVLVIVALSFAPVPHVSGAAGVDKIEHVLAYAVMMAWFCQVELGMRGRVLHAVGFLLLGVGIEVGQGMVPHRVGSVYDVVADGAGVVMGWVVVARWSGVLRRLES